MRELQHESLRSAEMIKHRAAAFETAFIASKKEAALTPVNHHQNVLHSAISIQRKPGQDEEFPVHRIPISYQTGPLHAFRFVQPKLSINHPDDIYEQEADALADKVMRMKNPLSSGNASISHAFKPIQRKCAACEEEEKHIHRKENAPGDMQGSDELDNYVSSLSSSGRALSESSRQFFEPRFGQDFSNVRVHTDSVAAKSAQSINALAYTTGNNIVFNIGQYSPGTESGQRLLAHELTHVVQQGGVQRKIQKTDEEKATVSDASCNFVSKTPIGEIFHFIVNTSRFVDGEENRLKKFLTSLPDGTDIGVVGMASSDGPSKLNEKLSCDRALVVADVIRHSSKVPKKIEATGGFTGTDYNNEFRAVSVETKAKPNIKPDPPQNQQCQPGNGIGPDQCSAYLANSSWLPSAYVHNATCACQSTPNSPKYNCIRTFLQNRLASTPTWLKSLGTTQKGNEFNPYAIPPYNLFVQTVLTPRIYQDHVDAYKNCCCKNAPAAYPAWIGVTTVPIRPCSLVGFSIDQFGNCDEDKSLFKDWGTSKFPYPDGTWYDKEGNMHTEPGPKF